MQAICKNICVNARIDIEPISYLRCVMGVFISWCTYAVAPSGVKMYLRFYCKKSSKCTNLCSQLVLHNNMNTLRQKTFCFNDLWSRNWPFNVDKIHITFLSHNFYCALVVTWLSEIGQVKKRALHILRKTVWMMIKISSILF